MFKVQSFALEQLQLFSVTTWTTSPTRKGGTSKRFVEDDVGEQQASSSSQVPLSGGISRRLKARDGETDESRVDYPLIRNFKRDWALGKLASSQVRVTVQRCSGGSSWNESTCQCGLIWDSHEKAPARLDRSVR